MDDKKGFGPHLTIDARKCDYAKLISFELVYDILDKLPGLIGMRKMEPPHVVKWVDEWSKTGTPGISGFVMITTSHISVHTFPDEDHVFIDLFSCKPFDIEKAKSYLIEAFSAQEVSVNLLKRGRSFPQVEYPASTQKLQ